MHGNYFYERGGGLNRRKIGEYYEQLTIDFLKSHGYEILCNNYYNPFGEIDIIAKDGQFLVFIEVKFRDGDLMGSAEEAVDFRKQNRMIKGAKHYMLTNRFSFDSPCRFDVVAINKNKIRLIRDAFWMES